MMTRGKWWITLSLIALSFLGGAAVHAEGAEGEAALKAIAGRAIEEAYGFEEPLTQYAFNETWELLELGGEPCWVLTYEHAFIPVKAGTYWAGIRPDGDAAEFVEWSYDGADTGHPFDIKMADVYGPGQLEAWAAAVKLMSIANEKRENNDYKMIEAEMRDQYETLHDLHWTQFGFFNEKFAIVVAKTQNAAENYIKEAWFALREKYGIEEELPSQYDIMSEIVYDTQTNSASYRIRFEPQKVLQDDVSYFTAYFDLSTGELANYYWWAADFWNDIAPILLKRGKTELIVERVEEDAFSKLLPTVQLRYIEAAEDAGLKMPSGLDYGLISLDEEKIDTFNVGQAIELATHLIRQLYPFSDEGFATYEMDCRLGVSRILGRRVWCVSFTPKLYPGQFMSYCFQICTSTGYLVRLDTISGAGPVTLENMVSIHTWARETAEKNEPYYLWTEEGYAAYHTFAAETDKKYGYRFINQKGEPGPNDVITPEKALEIAREALIERYGDMAEVIERLPASAIDLLIDDPEHPVWLVDLDLYSDDRPEGIPPLGDAIIGAIISSHTGEVIRIIEAYPAG